MPSCRKDCQQDIALILADSLNIKWKDGNHSVSPFYIYN